MVQKASCGHTCVCTLGGVGVIRVQPTDRGHCSTLIITETIFIGVVPTRLTCSHVHTEIALQYTQTHACVCAQEYCPKKVPCLCVFACIRVSVRVCVCVCVNSGTTYVHYETIGHVEMVIEWFLWAVKHFSKSLQCLTRTALFKIQMGPKS